MDDTKRYGDVVRGIFILCQSPFKNIFESNELDESVVIADIAITSQHEALANKTQSTTVKLYNLDTIIAVGYRVNSKEATQFRIWATKVLHEYIVKVFPQRSYV